MLKERLEKIKKEELIKLSQKSQEAINSMNWENLSEEIGKKYLIDEEVESFQIEILLVLLGLEKPEFLERNIMNSIITSEKEARELSDEVFEKIFSPIADKIEGEETSVVKTTTRPSNPRSSSLPEDLQQAIAESDYQTKLYVLGKKYNLAIDEMGILEGIVTNVMLGKIDSKDLEGEIKSKIEISEEKVVELIDEINQSIFKNIRELLKDNSLLRKGEGIIKEEEIPLPPYRKAEGNKEEELTEKPEPKPIEEKEGPDEDKTTKENDDVEFLDEPEVKDEVDHVLKEQEPDFYAKSGVELIEEKEDNRQIHIDEEKENKTLEDTGVDLIGEKLTNPTFNVSTVSDHSTPKINSLGDQKNNSDPYREEI